LADAALYAWRYCYNYLSQKPVAKPVPGTHAWFEAEVSEMESAAEEYFKGLEEATKGYGDY
jgi:hypothetical protein